MGSIRILFLLLLSISSFGQIQLLPPVVRQQTNAPASFVEPPPPSYNILGNIEAIWESPRMVVNTDNDYGIVDASGVPTTWKSIAPGPTGRNMTLAGTGEDPVIVNGAIYFKGQRRYRTGAPASNWNFLQHNGTGFSNLKWTIHIAGGVGDTVDPNWFYALMGNNSNSQTRRGISLYWDDRESIPRSNALNANITKGSAGYIILSAPEDILEPNSRFVLTIEVDGSQSEAARQKFYINNVLFAYSSASPSTSTAGTPSYDLEVGGLGNGSGGLYGSISHVVIQSRVESESVREDFVASLLPQNNRPYNPSPYVDETRQYQVYETFSETGRYYFVNGLLQNPFNHDEVIQIFHEGDLHVHAADKNLSYRKSTDNGRSFGSRVSFFDPPGTPAIQDAATGIDDNGRIHVVVDTHTTLSPGDVAQLFYLYSDDFGTTWTPTDITASVPNDGLLAYRPHGNIIQVENYLYAPLYKLADEGDVSSSARYIMRLPITGSTAWEFFLVEATTDPCRNESSIQALDDETILMLTRNEDTKLYSQYEIDLPTMTSISQGDISFGEIGGVTAGPPRLTKFKIGTSDVIMAWILNRSGGIVKYVLGTAVNLKSNGLTGWELSTKTEIVNDIQILHYGAFLHPNNNLNAIGAIARDPATWTENTMVYFDLPTTNYAAQKTALSTITPSNIDSVSIEEILPVSTKSPTIVFSHNEKQTVLTAKAWYQGNEVDAAFSWTLTNITTLSEYGPYNGQTLSEFLSLGRYHVEVTATNSTSWTVNAIAGIIVEKKPYTEGEADLVIDMTQVRNSTWSNPLGNLTVTQGTNAVFDFQDVVRDDFKIALKNNFTGNATTWSGLMATDEAHAVRIQNVGGQVVFTSTGSGVMMKFNDHMQYVHVSGNGVEGTQYGIKFVGRTSSGTQSALFQGIGLFIRGLSFSAVDFDQNRGQGASDGGPCFQWNTNDTDDLSDATCNWDNWDGDYLRLIGCKWTESWDENIYGGHTSNAVDGSGFRPYSIGDLWVLSCTFDGAGYNHIQFTGTTSALIANNYGNNSGLQGTNGQNQAISQNDGNRGNSYILRNYFENCDMFLVITNGYQGTGNHYYVGNVAIQRASVLSGSLNQFVFYNIENEASCHVVFANNTFKCPDVVIAPVCIQHDDGADFSDPTFGFYNNVISTGGTNQTTFPELRRVGNPGAGTGGYNISNTWERTADEADLKLNNLWRPHDITAPLFNAGISLSGLSLPLDGDIDGQTLNVNGGYSEGAFSGGKLFEP
jgi:hypothetical protein